MKRIIALILCAVMCVCFISCSNNDTPKAPMGMQYAADPKITDYILMVPDDWTIESSTGTTTAYYRDNLSNAVLATFTASFNSPSNPDVTLENYFESFITEFKEVFGEPENVEISNTTLSGEAAKQYVYTAKFGETEYKFWQVVCFRKNIIYTLTYSATEEYYDKYAEDMSLIIDNFSFKK